MRMVDFLYNKIAKPILFKIDPEVAHGMIFSGLKISSKLDIIKKLISYIYSNSSEPVLVNGIKFKNCLGFAAGFDKNAEIYDVIESFGFGFMEIGSVTLNPQQGNPKPRIFRIVDEYGIVNHMGLNNCGAIKVRKNIDKKGKPGITMGINIAKDNKCDFINAHKNISECFKILKDVGDFFVINISCPNVNSYAGNLSDYVHKIINSLREIDSEEPLFIKISPDIADNEVFDITLLCERYNCGIVATNTTKRRDIIKRRDFDKIEGGLSGKPLKNLSVNKLQKIRDTSKKVPIISSGGIFDSMDVSERKNLGADLFEIYTSFIYEGPSVVKKILNQGALKKS